jgi:hypothetical protein
MVLTFGDVLLLLSISYYIGLLFFQILHNVLMYIWNNVLFISGSMHCVGQSWGGRGEKGGGWGGRGEGGEEGEKMGRVEGRVEKDFNRKSIQRHVSARISRKNCQENDFVRISID